MWQDTQMAAPGSRATQEVHNSAQGHNGPQPGELHDLAKSVKMTDPEIQYLTVT
jgi:hypothetical protein